MLQVETLNKRYNDSIQALDHVSLQVNKGELACIYGPSGCGKTTLLLACGGLLKPDSGSVRINDHELYALNPNQRAAFRARHIGFVFQQFHLIPYLNALQNVLAAGLPTDSADNELRAIELLDMVGLGDRRTHKPAALSAGQNQRVALARALFHKPAVLLADEPTGNLDSSSGLEALELLKTISAECAVLIVSHDERVRSYADKQFSMDNGALVEL